MEDLGPNQPDRTPTRSKHSAQQPLVFTWKVMVHIEVVASALSQMKKLSYVA
jgi:hypothetical protein